MEFSPSGHFFCCLVFLSFGNEEKCKGYYSDHDIYQYIKLPQDRVKQETTQGSSKLLHRIRCSSLMTKPANTVTGVASSPDSRGLRLKSRPPPEACPHYFCGPLYHINVHHIVPSRDKNKQTPLPICEGDLTFILDHAILLICNC